MNPFDDAEATFVVLVNDERQFSLWPEFVDAPAGWKISHPAASRAECLAYVDRNWTDLRPASLINPTT